MSASKSRSGRKITRSGTLKEYNQRRDFARTREPRGEQAASGRHRFVVQKHDATRLHFDLRLEMDGVLKSWAVTRGPSLVAGEKRLAVQTEDHPMKYLTFEGVIPKGEYGGGSMIVWDQGTWQPLEDEERGMKKGHLSFRLKGKRLKGDWHLVRMRAKPRERRANWLLIKSDDEAAAPARARAITDTAQTSIKSGRTNAELARAGDLRPDHKARAKVAKAKPRQARVKIGRKAILPDFIEPQLATLSQRAPSTGGWLHEVKLDGYRIQARVDGGKVTLLTRKGLDWTRKFAAVAAALKARKLPSAVLDGEIVVEDETGRSDFSALQAALSGEGGAYLYRVFDLLYADGSDLRSAPLVERKRVLASMLAEPDGVIYVTEHLEEDGDAMVRHACRLGLEGIVSKRMDAPYRSGRGKSWLKTKCTARQELVIAGYVPSSVLKSSIGALVMGAPRDGALVHLGRVGTGFTQTVARALMKALKPLERETPPFKARVPALAAKGVRWVEPRLVAEVELRGFTGDGMIRHASFKGLRDDKAPADVSLEMPAPAVARGARAQGAFPLTHPDRVYWPDIGLTKLGLAEYYAAVADHILPHVAERPLALVRCPDGAESQCFFQKHGWRGMPGAIKTRRIRGDELIYIEDQDGLIALAQSGVLEIHPWGSRLADIEKPDRLILDFDPGPGVDWDDVLAAAEEGRRRLRAAGLKSFCKTTGGKGLHVVAPLAPRMDWNALKAFARKLAESMAADAPDRYVANMAKSRRKGRIFVDYLRNGRGSTAVAPFSTRARPGAPVATPVTWRELGDGITPGSFNVENLPVRLDALKRDPWSGFFSTKGEALSEPSSRRRSRS